MKRLLIELIAVLLLGVYVWWDCQPLFAHNGWEALKVSFAVCSLCWALWKTYIWQYLGRIYKADYLPFVLLAIWVLMELVVWIRPLIYWLLISLTR